MESDLPYRISEALELANMSSADLARELGVSKASVSKWINGISTPTEENLKRIAVALGVSAAWLRGESSAGMTHPSSYGLSSKLLSRPGFSRALGFRACEIRYPGMRPKKFDYVSGTLVAEIKSISHGQLGKALLSALWDLAVVARVDERARTPRHHALVLVVPEEDDGMAYQSPLITEASQLDVEVVVVGSVEEAQAYIDAFEQPA